ncbi:spectrin repeat containing nuclear envelope family member 4 [Rhinolophus ferrumequinum]|uniref:Spectrin repeat containing nuclear envelope family member 4 n=1 Tax=Rhinolophus ferrumequinum TaxID=59479 RepID=A0A7J7SL29_RHIFE|nr:spectrin repeat containing nuclear envelope family member 4 [Rhinolophus ferrumequinum]
MALPPPLDPRPPSEPLNHPPGAPREVDIARCTICPASGEEIIRPEHSQKLGQDSLDPPEHFQGGLRDTEPTAGHPRLPTPSSHEDPAVSKHRESPISGWEVLEAEQDNLHLCLLGLRLQLQDLERGPGPWTSAQSGMVQLQTLQADLRGAAERVDALLAFGEGLAQRSEPQARASLQQVLRAFRAHRDSIFRRLWQLQAQLVSYSLDILMSGFSHQKHLAGHRRRSLLRKSQDKKRQASSNLQDVMLEVDSGAPAPAPRRPLTFLLLLLLLFLLLVGATLLLPQSGGPCCSPVRLARTPYLVLSYVNGPPPI